MRLTVAVVMLVALGGCSTGAEPADVRPAATTAVEQDEPTLEPSADPECVASFDAARENADVTPLFLFPTLSPCGSVSDWYVAGLEAGFLTLEDDPDDLLELLGATCLGSDRATSDLPICVEVAEELPQYAPAD